MSTADSSASSWSGREPDGGGGTARRLQAHRRWVIASVVLVGLSVTCLLYWVLALRDSRLRRAEFGRGADVCASMVEREFVSGLEAVYSLMAFYASSVSVERHEFHAFCRWQLEHKTFIRALEWAPRTPGASRRGYEEAIRSLRDAEGLGDPLREALRSYEIREHSEGGAIVRADEREEYYPVDYVEPFEPNRSVLGFDVASEPMRREALLRARETGELAATEGLWLDEESGHGSSFLVFGPVYRARDLPSTVEEPRTEFLGVVVGAFRVGEVLRTLERQQELFDMDLVLRDETRRDDARDICAYRLRQAAHGLELSPLEDPGESVREHWSDHEFKFAGRQWKFYFSPTAAYLGARSSWGPATSVAVGLLITGLIAGYVFLLTQWNAGVQEKVAQRTQELRDINRRLEGEIREREQLTQALRVSEERFDLAVKGSSDGLWDWHPLTGDVYFSPRFKQLLGFEDQEMESTYSAWERLLHPEDLAGTLTAIRDHLERRVPYEVEYRLMTRSSGYRWFLARGQAVWDESGRAVRMAGSITDITQHRESQEKLEAQAEELARSNKDLEEFAYIASHDLRAPLRAISNLSEWIEDDLKGAMTDETRRQMGLLRERVRRMETLIDDLLAYSRAGREPIEPEHVDTAKLVDNVIFLLNPPRGFSIKVHGPLPSFETVKAPLEQVFANLIENAVKHHHRADGRVDISSRDLGASYEFSVADDGPGIAPRFHERVFQMFQKLESKDKVAGSGVGLALVKKLVERQGGKMTLESAEGRGAVFRFSWPKRQKVEVAP